MAPPSHQETELRIVTPATALADTILGRWIERVNTDAADYGGGRGNLGGVESRPVAAQGRSDSIEITLPPLATVVFELG